MSSPTQFVLRPVAVCCLIAVFAACAEPGAAPAAPRTGDAAFGKTTINNNTHPVLLLPNTGAYALLGDGAFTDSAGNAQYAHQVCGVQSVTHIDNGGGDWTLVSAYSRDRTCAAYPRRVYIGGKTNALVTATFLVPRLNQPGNEIPVGATMDKSLLISNSSRECSRYTFDGTNGSDQVSVTRTAVGTWLVQTKPAPNNRAFCSDGTGPYYMDVSFTLQQ